MLQWYWYCIFKKRSMPSDIYKYGEDITWSLPLAFQYEAVWGTIFKMFKLHGIEIPQVNGFGCPSCAWTGGRAPAIRQKLPHQALQKLFEYMHEIKLTPSFTFTCSQLTWNDLNDSYANYILDMALEVGAHFIIYDDRLRDHIKNKNAGAYCVASVVKPAFQFQGENRIEAPNAENETEFYNNLLKGYDLVVVRPEYSRTVMLENPDWIDDISRIEVLINQPCIPNCPRMPNHYRHLESYRNGNSGNQNHFECARATLKPEVALTTTVCHDEDMVNTLIEYGVRHLKLQGRGVGTPPLVLMHQLYTQIFKTTGASNLVYTMLGPEALDSELRQFGQTSMPIQQTAMPRPMNQQMAPRSYGYRPYIKGGL